MPLPKANMKQIVDPNMLTGLMVNHLKEIKRSTKSAESMLLKKLFGNDDFTAGLLSYISTTENQSCRGGNRRGAPHK